MKRAILSALALGAAHLADAIAVGDSVPSMDLHHGFPPEKINLRERVANKNVILVTLPGAFTPTWSTVQVPGYIEKADDLKKQGIDEVIVFCVNDGAVMDAWGKDQGIEKAGGLITFMGDPTGELTDAMDIELEHPGPKGKGLVNRCKRTAMYLEDGVVKVMRIAERFDDPAGDDFPDVTLAGAMLEAIASFKHQEL